MQKQIKTAHLDVQFGGLCGLLKLTDIRQSIRSGIEIHKPDTTINGIRVNVSPFDYIIAGDTLNIVSRSPPPDGKYVLACYRYNSIHYRRQELWN